MASMTETQSKQHGCRYDMIMTVSIHSGSFLWEIRRALPFGVCVWAPDFFQIPHMSRTSVKGGGLTVASEEPRFYLPLT